ncbi:MAG: bifunctional diaminohydroxyphosphoribosylaminopyrimidine deaminase/5-amino-6-(5-phosphoribosylamino)uracil reductase RibD [Tannerellaceae bacterium]|jgi:diaminohydroxyphosphoribosylaminopyrimidine deaminase/5-amino-6-(5-phosphoribosylamino)uracil reductase|nr:bifunctional diaminohydroxyphosphoribosylaminopyrimidine deaminase/5-amino-6-(5-phosphoribosylamino)uracil reductase RibD [Tannerellaceae bacterium]
MNREHSFYMGRCMELAQKGRGFTMPNPMVGAVIVHKGRIIGEGFHRKAGEAHAEVNAIASVHDESLLGESTLYVNLEPCSHYGKTPPCAELIIRKQIPRVVIGCLDPFPKVSGKGVSLLLKAGVEVITGIMEPEARELNKAFITFHEKGRPYVVLKWAQSADGFIDRKRTDHSVPSVVLSSPESRREVHKLRSEVSAILTGTRTVLLDNPSLSVRHWQGQSPVRLTIDHHLCIPSHYHILDGTVPTVIFTSREAKNGKNITYIPLDPDRSTLQQILHYLKEEKLNSLLIEGGSELLQSVLAEDCWDEARIEIVSRKLGEGVKAPEIFRSKSPCMIAGSKKTGNREDIILWYKNMDTGAARH